MNDELDFEKIAREHFVVPSDAAVRSLTQRLRIVHEHGKELGRQAGLTLAADLCDVAATDTRYPVTVIGFACALGKVIRKQIATP